MTTPQNPHFTTRSCMPTGWAVPSMAPFTSLSTPRVQYGFDKVEDLDSRFGHRQGWLQLCPPRHAHQPRWRQRSRRWSRGRAPSSLPPAWQHLRHFFTLLKAGTIWWPAVRVWQHQQRVRHLADLGIERSPRWTRRMPRRWLPPRPHTRMVFVETIANPGTILTSKAWRTVQRARASLCGGQHGGIAYLFRRASVGAGLVVHSLTKASVGRAMRWARRDRHRCL